MVIPEECTVLVVGGGPGGSYAATVLAHEGINTVLLEAEKMPRYHVGETMLPTIRYYLRCIDLESEFDKHGFTNSAELSDPPRRKKSGAKTFDGVTVTSIDFVSSNGANGSTVHSPGKPIPASWFKNKDGTSGAINFSYIIDAIGRAGLLTTKYLKNRHYNSTINKTVSWEYFKNAGNTERVQNRRKFRYETGWTWLVPLHDGTSSVGIIRDYALAQEKIKAAGSEWEYCKEPLEQAPPVSSLLADAKAVTGDHLAITHAVSAATSIAASIRGDFDEVVAAQWHSRKIVEVYSRFLLLVLSAYKQIRPSESFNASNFSQEGFDREFGIFQSVTGGSQNDTGKITQEEFSHTYEFLIHAFKVHFDHTDGLTKQNVDALQAFRSHQGSQIMNNNSFTSE
ncbi:putative Aromatic-ring hydroxylase-like protein [Seiridium cardinale]|uniref:Aromatic-ring hydroxylase-like protein n=1 Tax=Seiridium cardinale TaxID=138064 RepID=A0ABR2XUB3_9PEZI